MKRRLISLASGALAILCASTVFGQVAVKEFALNSHILVYNVVKSGSSMDFRLESSGSLTRTPVSHATVQEKEFLILRRNKTQPEVTVSPTEEFSVIKYFTIKDSRGLVRRYYEPQGISKYRILRAGEKNSGSKEDEETFSMPLRTSSPNIEEASLQELYGGGSSNNDLMYGFSRVYFSNSSMAVLNPVGAQVGTASAVGSTSVVAGVYTVEGSGSGFGGTSDSGYFASQSLKSDLEMIVRLTDVSGGSEPVAGLAVRDASGVGAKMAWIGILGGNVVFSKRTSDNATAVSTVAGLAPGDPNNWLRLVRRGGVLRGYFSPDGTAWTEAGKVEIPEGSALQTGMFVSSGSVSELTTAHVDNIRLITPSESSGDVTSLHAGTPILDIDGPRTSGSYFSDGNNNAGIYRVKLPRIPLFFAGHWQDQSYKTTSLGGSGIQVPQMAEVTRASGSQKALIQLSLTYSINADPGDDLIFNTEDDSRLSMQKCVNLVASELEAMGYDLLK